MSNFPVMAIMEKKIKFSLLSNGSVVFALPNLSENRWVAIIIPHELFEDEQKSHDTENECLAEMCFLGGANGTIN